MQSDGPDIHEPKESPFPADHRTMDLGLEIAASGMVAQQVRQDQLANNLANAVDLF